MNVCDGVLCPALIIFHAQEEQSIITVIADHFFINEKK